MDAQDYDWLVARGRWHLSALRYAADSRWQFMHRVILGLGPGDKRQVDHINGHGLDNRRANLRIASQSQNMMNVLPRGGRYSKHRGVTYDKRANLTKRWIAQARLEGRPRFLGRYATEEEAAEAAAAFRREHMPYAAR